MVANRLSVWSSRLVEPGNSATIVAENGAGLTGFVHVVFDDDARWGSLIDTAAQQFYHAMGGINVESGHVAPPGGVASRLNGSPGNFRIAWPDVTDLGSRL